MASLYKRRRKFWVSYYLGGQQIQRPLHTDSERIARGKVKQLEYDLSLGDLRQASKLPLVTVLEAYSKHLKGIRTYKSWKTDLGRLRVLFGPICEALIIRPPGSPAAGRQARPMADKYAGRHLQVELLEDLSPELINRFFSARVQEDNWKPKTSNNYRQVLHQVFVFATKHFGFCARDRRYANPATSVDRRREPASDIRFLTMEQIDEQLRVLQEQPVIRTMVAVCIYAGLRREEAIRLTPKDVDLKERLLRVRAKTINGDSWQPKTRRNRVVPISDALLTILQEFAPKAGAVWYFASPCGRRWDPDNFSQDLREINKAHGLVWGSLDYRHTFGSHLAMKGESLYKISALMGNSPEICRKHYAALIPEQMRDTVEFVRPEVQEPKNVVSTEALVAELLRRVQQEKGSPPALPPQLRLAR
jgi:integrase